MRGPSRLDEDWEETDPHYALKRLHGQVLIDRLARLLQAGYRIDMRQLHTGLGIPLKHPSKKMPALKLHDDGLINDQFPSRFRDQPDEHRTLFEPEDTQGFDRFATRIDKPNWLQRVSITPVGEATELLIGFIILIGFFWGFGRLLEWGWDSLRNTF